MPDTILIALYILFKFQSYEIDPIIIPILRIKKLRYKGIKWFAQILLADLLFKPRQPGSRLYCALNYYCPLAMRYCSYDLFPF